MNAGADVVGASVDSEALNAEFSEKEGLEFKLVSDPEKRLTGALGILVESEKRGEIASRVTYLIDPDGTILKRWEVGSGDAIDTHPDEVLAEVRRLHTGSDPV